MNLDDLEKKLEEATARLEQRIEDLGRRLEERTSGLSRTPSERKTHQRESPFWGIVLVVVGFILLANHFDWFDMRLPLIPAALMILGLFLLIENR